jgi:GNAT superfamily N-acetyltransferase
MNAAIRLRCLTPADLHFADSVRALEGWNQTLQDWERFLAMEPDGCFLAEWQGRPAGTATTIIYGPERAWIGMVLVHPDFRRRGIGRALLRHCIDYLQSRAVRCIKLDATPAGKTVYEALGFRAEWALTRWQRNRSVGNANAPGDGISDLRETGLETLEELDASAFGVSRRRLLEALVAQRCQALVLQSDGHVLGYGLLREGSRALYLGPVVASGAADAIRLVKALLEKSVGQTIFWDIPDRHRVAVAWAEANGFEPQRFLTRMFLGENTAPGSPDKIFAIAGPEIG